MRTLAFAFLLAVVLFAVVLPLPTPAQQAPPPQTAPATATIHVQALRQPIYGFGGTQTYNGDPLAAFANRDAAYKALFADARIDILRLRNYHDYPGQQEAFETRTREFASGALRWSKPADRNGKSPVRLMFTAWSPPPRLKSNSLVSGRSDGTDKGLENVTLKRNPDGTYAYAEYADWWAESLKKFREIVGVLPDYLAIQNELDIAVSYEGCEFLPTEGTGKGGAAFAGYDRALAAVSDKLSGTFGASVPKIIGPETFTIRMDAPGKTHPQQFADPNTEIGRAALARLFAVSFHIYGSGVESPDPTQFHTLLKSLQQTYLPGGKGKPLFETEFIEGATLTALAGQIHDTFTIGGASVYMVWILARSVTQPGYALVYYNPYDGSVERRERFYAVKHFSAFVGEGWTRVEADSGDPDVNLSAYVGSSGKELVAVLINPTKTERRMTLTADGNFADADTAQFRSTEGESGERWQERGALPANRLVKLPAKSVTTIRFVAKTAP